MGEQPAIDHSKMEGTKEIPKNIPAGEAAIRLQRAEYQGGVIEKAWPAGEGGMGVLGRLGKRKRKMDELILEDAAGLQKGIVDAEKTGDAQAIIEAKKRAQES